MRFICDVKTWNNIISLINNLNDFIAIKETSKYSVKSSDYLTGDSEKDSEIISDLEQGLYRKRTLSYSGSLKQKHKILNLDDDEEGKTHSITAIWNFEKRNYYLKASVFYVFLPLREL